jgi:hypothetical protein
MLRRLIGATLPLAVAVMLASGSIFAQEEKKAPAPKDSATLPEGEYVGTVKTTPASDRTFIVTIEEKKLVQGPARRGSGKVPVFVGYPGLNSAYNRLASAQTKYIQAEAKLANARGKAIVKAEQNLSNAGTHLLQAASNFQTAAVATGIRNTAILNNAVAKSLRNLRIQVTKTDVEFQTKETVKVRTIDPPEQFDEKGNPKKYTQKELNELKGKDKTLPGYESALEKLEAGQTVKVHMHEAAVKKKTDENDKDAAVKDPEKKKQVKMIVILAEANPDTEKPKKKRNN